jgi:hypothetical protein
MKTYGDVKAAPGTCETRESLQEMCLLLYRSLKPKGRVLIGENLVKSLLDYRNLYENIFF